MKLHGIFHIALGTHVESSGLSFTEAT